MDDMVLNAIEACKADCVALMHALDDVTRRCPQDVQDTFFTRVSSLNLDYLALWHAYLDVTESDMANRPSIADACDIARANMEM